MKLKTMLAIGLVGLVSRAEPYFTSIKDNQIEITPTSRTYNYTLQSKTDLSDESWVDEVTQRGNESNLVFEVNADTTKFFKAKVTYTPLEPIVMNMEAQTSSNPSVTKYRYFDFIINNYETNDIRTEIIFDDIINVYNIDYEIDLPKTNSLVPGENIIPITLKFITSAYGLTLRGKFKAIRLD